MAFPKEVENLSELFSYLPNVGPKLSGRLALYLGINGKELAKRLSNALIDVVNNVRKCNECGNISNGLICDICSDEQRDKSTLLIVEDPLDLINIESTKEFKGLYHVLNALISPMNGIGPEELSIPNIIKRIKSLNVKELIFALNPNMEGESTTYYLKQEILKECSDIKITRLAKGIPVGGDIEFVSNQTIIDSMRSRVSV